jgi:hypothetical protein
MTFIVRAIETVTEIVDVYYPDQEKPVEMPVAVRYIGEKEREELIDALDRTKCEEKDQEVMTDEEIMQRIIQDIPGLETEEGKSLTYNKKLLTQLLDVRCYREALQHLVRSVLYSKEFAEKFRQKNLLKQGATGQVSK